MGKYFYVEENVIDDLNKILHGIIAANDTPLTLRIEGSNYGGDNRKSEYFAMGKYLSCRYDAENAVGIWIGASAHREKPDAKLSMVLYSQEDNSIDELLKEYFPEAKYHDEGNEYLILIEGSPKTFASNMIQMLQAMPRLSKTTKQQMNEKLEAAKEFFNRDDKDDFEEIIIPIADMPLKESMKRQGLK
jgi:hypothetical protein